MLDTKSDQHRDFFVTTYMFTMKNNGQGHEQYVRNVYNDRLSKLGLYISISCVIWIAKARVKELAWHLSSTKNIEVDAP